MFLPSIFSKLQKKIGELSQRRNSGASWVDLLETLVFPTILPEDVEGLRFLSCTGVKQSLFLLSVNFWFGCADNWKGEGFFPSLESWLVVDKLPCGFFLGARWLLFQADVISCYLSVFQPASLQNYFWSGQHAFVWDHFFFFSFFLWVWGKQDAEDKAVEPGYNSWWSSACWSQTLGWAEEKC